MADIKDILGLINNSGLSTSMGRFGGAVLAHAMQKLIGNREADDGLSDAEKRKKQDAILLDMVGPAAASAAVEYAIHHCRKADPAFAKLSFNGNFINNVKIVHNDPGEFPAWTSTLRQFLLPRYAYLDFDSIVDPRHRVNAECGYPKFITPIMYRYMYDRDDMARRVVDVYPNESWAIDPDVYEDPDESTETEFETAWREHCEEFNVLPYLYRLDRLSGIGHYAAMLFGLDDGEDLEKPLDELPLLAGIKRSVGKQKRQLLYMRPFDEYLSFIHQYEIDTSSPRYGLPKYYNLVFLDMTIDAAGASIGTRLNRRVHWSRVLHVADNLQSSLVFGIPRMQSVFNRLLDLRKIKGGSAEMFWKGAYPGLSFEVDPKFVADQPEFDPKELRREVQDYLDGLEKAVFTQGVKVTSLNPTICDHPERFVGVQIQAIASALEMPMRVFLGSEEAKLASAHDLQTWNKRLSRRCRMHLTPSIVRAYVDRLIAYGVLPPPKSGKYFVEWNDIDSPTDEDKANLALKWTQAMSQYVSTGLIHLIDPMEFFTMIMGLRPSQVKKVIDSKGDFAKLKSVDPSKAAGANDNPTGKKGTSGGRPES